MKFFIYSVVILLVATLALYLINPSLFQSLQNSITNKISNVIPVESLSNKTTIYKWKNNKGEIQITNTPPPAGVKYSTEKVPHGTNIMPSNALTGKSSKN